MRIFFTKLIFLLIINSSSAQILLENDRLGIVGQGRILPPNKASGISGFTYSIGGFYQYIKSDFYSFPLYISLEKDFYTVKTIKNRLDKDYINLELAYRKMIQFNFGWDFYFETGIQNRLLLDKSNIFPLNYEDYDLRRFQMLPKVGIGLDLYIWRTLMLAMSLEYLHSVIPAFQKNNKIFNKYLGFKVSVPIIN